MISLYQLEKVLAQSLNLYILEEVAYIIQSLNNATISSTFYCLNISKKFLLSYKLHIKDKHIINSYFIFISQILIFFN